MAVSLKATLEGLQVVDQARKVKGWLKADPEWRRTTGLSPATFKQFWGGYSIRRERFIALTEAVGVEWHTVAYIKPTPKPTPTREMLTKMKASMAEIFETSGQFDPNKINAAQAYASLVIAETALLNQPDVPPDNSRKEFGKRSTQLNY